MPVYSCIITAHSTVIRISIVRVAYTHHEQSIFLILNTSNWYMVIYWFWHSKLFLLFLINNDDLVPSLVGLCLEFRSLCAEWLRFKANASLFHLLTRRYHLASLTFAITNINGSIITIVIIVIVVLLLYIVISFIRDVTFNDIMNYIKKGYINVLISRNIHTLFTIVINDVWS